MLKNPMAVPMVLMTGVERELDSIKQKVISAVRDGQQLHITMEADTEPIVDLFGRVEDYLYMGVVYTIKVGRPAQFQIDADA